MLVNRDDVQANNGIVKFSVYGCMAAITAFMNLHCALTHQGQAPFIYNTAVCEPNLFLRLLTTTGFFQVTCAYEHE